MAGKAGAKQISWTSERINILRILYDLGVHASEMAELYNTSIYNIQRVLTTNGISSENSWTHSDECFVLELKHKGFTNKAIAECMGRTLPSIERRIQRFIREGRWVPKKKRTL